MKVAPTPVTSLQSSGTIAEPETKSPETGPRKAGARRSTPRRRRGTNVDSEAS